ncbi:hypothetical protein [uncultured Streptococcus sp.]|nr:hypothetical protein [uncultured Streptococcus sp.]
MRQTDRKRLLLQRAHIQKQEEAGTKVLASSCFWIIEQDAVVEWALLR